MHSPRDKSIFGIFLSLERKLFVELWLVNILANHTRTHTAVHS